MEYLAEAPNSSLEDQRTVWEYGGWPLQTLGSRQLRRDVVQCPGTGSKTVEALSTAPEGTVRIRLAKRLADEWGQWGPYRQPLPPKHWRQYGLDVLTRMAASDPSARVPMCAAAQISFHPLADILAVPGWRVCEKRADELEDLLAEHRYREVVEKLAPDWDQPLGDLFDIAGMLGFNPQTAVPQKHPEVRQHRLRQST